MKIISKICQFAVNVWSEATRVPRLLIEVMRLLALKLSHWMKRVRTWFINARMGRIIGRQKRRMSRRKLILLRYTYCRAGETPLPLFIQATRYKNYQALRRTGHPDEALLKEAHAALMLEFAALSGNREYKNIVYTYKKIAGISARLLRLQLLLRLRDMGMDTAAEVRAATGGRDVKAYVKGNTRERDALLAKIQKVADMDESGDLDFDRVLVDLSKWLKMPLRPEDLTVASFAHYIKDFHDALSKK